VRKWKPKDWAEPFKGQEPRKRPKMKRDDQMMPIDLTLVSYLE